MIKIAEVKFKEDVVLKVNNNYPKPFKKGEIFEVRNSKKGNLLVHLPNKHGWVTVNKDEFNNAVEVESEKFYRSMYDMFKTLSEDEVKKYYS